MTQRDRIARFESADLAFGLAALLLGLLLLQQRLEAPDQRGDTCSYALVARGRRRSSHVGEVDEADVGGVGLSWRRGRGRRHFAVVQEEEGAGDELRSLLLVKPRPELVETPQKLNKPQCATSLDAVAYRHELQALTASSSLTVLAPSSDGKKWRKAGARSATDVIPRPKCLSNST
jgi:hypothetical protein